MNQTCKSNASLQENFEEKSSHQFLTVKQFCTKYPWPSESALRAYIFRANELKMTNVFLRVGRRVLVNVNNFFTAIEKEGGNRE